MNAAPDRAQAHRLVDSLLGFPDEAAEWAVSVLNAHAAALEWVRGATGAYPTPPSVASHLAAAAERLRRGDDRRDPSVVLNEEAAEALAAYRATTAA